ncbi:MAG: protein tyrosine phosphatase [Gemmatimonadetes bacterium]|nr:protein tyrosine phosphatase [Gemmatimonadota bacterium]
MGTVRLCCGVLTLLGCAAFPTRVSGQRAAPPARKTVLFVCEHGTVKSLLAKVLFEEYAQEVGLNVQAVSRGTRPDTAVPPWMLSGLALDHIALGSWRPQLLGAQDLAAASYVVSFDVPSNATAAARVPRTQWDSLPSVTQNYAKGRNAIKARVHQLVDSLKRAEQARRPEPV